ncbi:44635_t:CDS:2 [Gigaspora margarita]|uniref:44635_t:CDS:1 n=1 Tax=Gigaspora margarita TaxID=4874 RepID=A0ABN7VN78_GIGMA|nr:44635_t:CDS:2 [Gigaspora margarita]
MTNKRPQLNIKLISLGAIIPCLHYKISNKNFYTQVLEGNKKHEHRPGYQHQVGLKSSDIEETPSSAITYLYRCQSLTGIKFCPFLIRVNKYNIYITALECPNEADKIRAGVGYTAMFTGDYLSKCVIYIQRIDLDKCHIEIYQDGMSKYYFIDKTPNEVWKASKKLKKFRETQLFGLEHPLTHQIAHSIKCHICLGYNFQNRDDIVDAIKDIRGTSVANINPEYFTFSPIDIKKTINDQEFTKPDPKISNHTIPNSECTIPLPSSKAVKTELKKRKIVYEDKENKCDLVAILRKDIGEEIQREVKDDGLSSIDISTSKLKKHQVICSKNNQEKIELKPIYFDLGWALRERQEYSKHELQKKVEIGELEADEIPKIKIVENWITRYNQEYKKESAKKELYIPVDK